MTKETTVSSNTKHIVKGTFALLAEYSYPSSDI